MNIPPHLSEDNDRIMHRILFGVDGDIPEPPPAYFVDEEVILEAVEAVFGRVPLTWKTDVGRRGRSAGVTVCLQGTDDDAACCGGSRAEALCAAAIRLAAQRAPQRSPVDVATGFYWFRPAPYRPVYAFDVSDVGLHRYLRSPFVFTSDEPFPVFLHQLEGRWLVTGAARPLDWPQSTNCGDWAAIALDELPGELGPRIEAPATWGTERQPERLIMEPLEIVFREEPECGYVDVWTGERVEQEGDTEGGTG